ncbi:hypothetical protein [Hyphomicrobium sp. DY-1]|uniref:hypothetical protein n=1 Tax=Hyphomicrobium sp. DY-1 TaxID=3075650 RepID=UPI0039C04B2E
MNRYLVAGAVLALAGALFVIGGYHGQQTVAEMLNERSVLAGVVLVSIGGLLLGFGFVSRRI